MPRFWHPRMNWYGPAGIGTGGDRRFSGLASDPVPAGYAGSRQQGCRDLYHFFGDNDYAAVTGWPNMIQTISHDGWLGIPPLNKEITMRSLDFWRVENGLIRENWVMVDLLHMYDQIGVDVFARLREFNKSRVLSRSAMRIAHDTLAPHSFFLPCWTPRACRRRFVGIGLGCAVALAEAGAHVTIMARREDQLASVVGAMVNAGMSAEAMRGTYLMSTKWQHWSMKSGQSMCSSIAQAWPGTVPQRTRPLTILMLS